LNTEKPTIIAIALAITMAVGMVAVGSIIAQRALADKVGPHPNENLVKQGGLREYFSSAGHAAYKSPTGSDFGSQISTFAQPGDQVGGHESFGVKNAGANFAYYASGTCHTLPQPCE
jgi:hypothetical protein